MENYTATSFGDYNADDYDAHTRRQDTMETVALLAELAGAGPALELAIGTGRIGLPLTARGVRVDGIDASVRMIEKLRAKPGGERLSITIGNFADVDVSGTYRLIFIVYNTIFNLVTQDEQVRCFQNVAAHLSSDGLFVVEALVPDLNQFRNNQYVDAEYIGLEEVRFDVGRLDPVQQRLDETHVHLSREGIRLHPVVTRFIWPSELDLMARIAGLRLRERWASWTREPFDARSTSHISVYGRAA
jgi:hypothetical protein